MRRAESPQLYEVARAAKMDPRTVEAHANALAEIIFGVKLSDLKNDPALRLAIRQYFPCYPPCCDSERGGQREARPGRIVDP